MNKEKVYDNEVRKKKRFSFLKFYQLLLLLIFIGISGLNFYVLFKLDVLPLKYLLIYGGVIFLSFIISFKIFTKRKKKRGIFNKFWTFIMTLVVGASALGSLYLYKTYDFLNGFLEIGYKTETYYVMVLKSSGYNNMNDIKNSVIEYIDIKDMHYEKAYDEIFKKYKMNNVMVSSYEALINNIENEKASSMLFEKSQLQTFYEEEPDMKSELKSIYEFKIKVKKGNIAKEVDVSKKAFNVYISGLDTYGDIDEVSRTDVNMVVTVNPNTHQVLLTSIPRDYYVQIHDTTGYRDKLTHSGIYGIESSVGTIEDLFDIDINYYVKVNFTTLIKLIDAIDGVDINNPYSFLGYEYSTFDAGNIHLNGRQALEFARTRKTLKDGDNDRIKNQQLITDGIIRKVTSKDIITKYTNILSALGGSFDTNMTMKEIRKLLKVQLDTMAKWTVTSNVVTGEDSFNYTYSMPSQSLYVMEPDLESVSLASDMINQVLNGEILDDSYNN